MARKRKSEDDTLTHLDARGAARMVDVGGKPSTHRVAMAEAFIRMKPETLNLLMEGSIKKGDPLSVARITGIQATKRTSDLIPLAHPIPLTHAAVDLIFEPDKNGVRIETRAETIGSTGVELEALVAAASSALAIYDMCKSYDRGMVIERVQLLMKSGGRSGTYRRAERRGETEKSDGAPKSKKKNAKKKSAQRKSAKKVTRKPPRKKKTGD